MKTHKNLRDKLKVEIRVRDAFAIQKIFTTVKEKHVNKESFWSENSIENLISYSFFLIPTHRTK